MMSRHERIQGDDPQPVNHAHAVERCHRGRLVQQHRAQFGPVVMVAHHPDEFGTQLGGERLNQTAKLSICLRLAGIGQIAGEDGRIRT